MEKQKISLPENAQRELAPGEEYHPILGAEKTFKEVTAYSVAVGILMVILFSAAAAYLGLKVGQVFEAAIPIAIIAVGLTTALGKKDGLGQNVIIQSIGGCSGAVVAGAIFTLPAIYILGVEVNFWQMFLSSLLGGVLGAMVSMLGTVLPPFVIIAIISFFYQSFRDNYVVATVMRGMQAGVAAVIVDAVIKMAVNVAKEKSVLSYIIMFAAFIVAYFFDVNVVFVILACAAVGIIATVIREKRNKAAKEGGK